MKNRKKQKKNYNLDTSYDFLQKNNNTKINNEFQRENNIYRNKTNLNKSNYTFNDSKNLNNKNSGIFQTTKENKTNKNKSKEKLFKCKNTSFKRICNTPDRKIKYNMGFIPNKNNVSVLKLTNKNDRNIFGYHRYKNLYNNYLSNERKKALTPDKPKKNNFANVKKIEDSEFKNYSFLYKNKFTSDFSKSFYYSNFDYTKNTSDKYHLFNKSSSNYYNKKDNRKNQTSDKFHKNFDNSDLKKKISSKPPISNNKSKLKFSRSFCLKNDRNNRKFYNLRKSSEKNYLLSNSQINCVNKNLDKKNNSKILLRAKSTNSNVVKRNYLYSDGNTKHNFKYRNYKNYNDNNSSFEFSKKSRQKNDFQSNIKHPLNNINSYQKKNEFNYSKNYENCLNKNDMTFSQKKANKDLGKIDCPDNNCNNINSASFIEKELNKVQNNKKYNKFVGINAFMTKSSTNTYDDINSSNSIISKKNTSLDSIEEIHFNFVNVLQNSKNLMKMENKTGDKIIDNNINGSVLLVEERDID